MYDDILINDRPINDDEIKKLDTLYQTKYKHIEYMDIEDFIGLILMNYEICGNDMCFSEFLDLEDPLSAILTIDAEKERDVIDELS